jgi:NADH:ubiquinone oxidoreductase subunit F (NADH-binding)
VEIPAKCLQIAIKQAKQLGVLGSGIFESNLWSAYALVGLGLRF